MSKEFLLFEKDEESLQIRLMRLQDLLVKNKTSTKVEFTFFFAIFYVQIISGFFSSNLKILDLENSISDSSLNFLNKIFRIKELFYHNPDSLSLFLILIFLSLIFSSLFYIYIFINFSRSSIYSYREKILNMIIKIFLYLLFNPILDMCLSIFCLTEVNHSFENKTCNFADDPLIYLCAILILSFSIILCFAINIFYHDCQFLSKNSYYSRMNCNYEIYLTINNIIYAVLLSQTYYLGIELFLLYNILSSSILAWFYFTRYIYYDDSTNKLVGSFHLMYIWTSLYFFIFSLFEYSEKGIIYFVGLLIIEYLYENLSVENKEKAFLNIPFYKIKNKFYILFYIKSLLMKIYNINSNISDKADLIGMIENHILECPQRDCATKNKNIKIFLPSLNEWSERNKNEISDEVFLYNFPIFIINYYIKNDLVSPDLLINLSYYYLTVIGNYCKAMMFFNVVKSMKLGLQEKFSLMRLKFVISKALLKNLSPTSEGCTSLNELNVTLYFKYEDLSQKFLDEISNDLNLLLEFWKILKHHIEANRIMDFNKIFYLTDKIRISKNQIENLWKNLFDIFSGINTLFGLYENYVEQINDDDLLKRELDAVKSKNLIVENIQINYYNLLFNPSTGIIIANGDKFKEGIIEKANDEVERIFEYKVNELKGMNVTMMIPKEITKKHKSFMRRFYDIGEKKILDKQLRSYAKDKENCIIPVQLYVKLFPVLADHTFFIGLIKREFTDDIIILDQKFNIQCCSRKLMDIMEIHNKLIFFDMEIPFYLICKNFVYFFKTFLKKHNKKNIDASMINYIDMDQEEVVERENYEINEEIEVGENTELEYVLAVPSFIHEYTVRASSQETSFEETSLNESKINTFTNGDLDEKEALVENKEKTEKENANDLENFKVEKSERSQLHNQQDKRMEFLKKIGKYKELFEFGKFTELEDYIDVVNQNVTNKYKFNFTFQVYCYGESEKLYVVRCIDNKNEFDGSEPSNNKNKDDDKDFPSKYYKSKEKALEDIEQTTDEERKIILEKPESYLKMCRDDRGFIKTQYVYKQEIESFSRLFSNKRERTVNKIAIDDDQGSQASSAGYNDSLSKKSRLIEIRSNIMNNAANFYTIKWIKLISILVFFFTVSFSIFFLLIFDGIYHDLTTVSQLNISLFQTAIWMSNIVSSFISMRYVHNSTLINYPIKYNSFISDKDLYFETLRNNSLRWYKNIIVDFGMVDKNIHYYLTSKNDIFWVPIDVTYPGKGLNKPDTEIFSFSLMQVLSENIDLIRNQYFSLKYLNDFKKDIKNLKNISLINSSKPIKDQDLIKIEYSGFLTIENSIDNLLPKMIDLLNISPGKFKSHNDTDIFYINISMIAYSIVFMILLFTYSLVLYLTNKNIQEGLEKICRISLSNIEDTIKKIENFNEKYLSKFMKREIKNIPEDTNDVFDEKSKENSQIEKFKNFDVKKKYINLKVLTYNYLQIFLVLILVLAILIPIYFISSKIINDSNKILSVQSYIFGKSLKASIDTVNIKCMISVCDIQKQLNDDFSYINRNEIEAVLRDMGEFEELVDFYNNKFLLNACAVIYNNTESDKYKSCMNDTIIQEANNTDSLLNLLHETADIIERDRDIKRDKPYKFNGEIVEFSNPLLFETEYFRTLEYIFYNYITSISDNFENIVRNSLNDYLLHNRLVIIILSITFGFLILLFSFYVTFGLTKNLINLLSISRCIFRIIPTTIINNTKELEAWIENRN